MRFLGHLGKIFLVLIFILLITGCDNKLTDNPVTVDRLPDIKPDYENITIPPNIAPMNFKVMEEGSSFKITATSDNGGHRLVVRSSDGIVRFREKSWRKLLDESIGEKINFEIISAGRNGVKKYETFYMQVAKEPVDPYLAYRLIYPGYYNWSTIRIMQRSLESFREETLVDNRILDMNCINCHSFSQYDPGKFMVHIRGSHGATYFAKDGKITKRDPKIDAMPGGATYPSWHPGGRFLAFSSNQVRQGFYARPERTIEVFDLVSAMIIYDLENNETLIAKEKDTTKYLQTFPSWSPDGHFLYYCRAMQVNTETSMTLEQINQTKYDIVRMSFDPENMKLGEPEMVFNASGRSKSASFPRISPDGRFLLFTLADFGTFPIWHREADLYLLDLASGETIRLDINSNDTESYHTWSSNGKWIVFSSKRSDGRSTRPFFAYFSSWDSIDKPFILPQRDPTYYDRLMESFNIPELVKGKIAFNPHDFERVSGETAIKAQPLNPKDSLSRWEIRNIKVKRNPGEKSIHE